MWVPVVVLVVVVVALVVRTVLARQHGYRIGGETVVRCRQGHLFMTLWVPGASVKAVRLGGTRFQHCPVGTHWTLVRPVRDADLTEEDRRVAAEHHDLHVP